MPHDAPALKPEQIQMIAQWIKQGATIVDDRGLPLLNIYTIGYESLALEDFLHRLQRVRIQTLVDVRDVPLSRKRGFSKIALATAVGAAGMHYLHIRSLGCPKAIRDQYRADRDWSAYTVALMRHLQEQTRCSPQL
jgi:hypothetical protein